MKKTKTVTKRTAGKTRRAARHRTVSGQLYGLEHDFIIIVSGGFLVIILVVMLFLR